MTANIKIQNSESEDPLHVERVLPAPCLALKRYKQPLRASQSVELDSAVVAANAHPLPLWPRLC